MFCNHCGAQIADNSRFCNLCGKAIPDFSPVQPEPESVVQSDDQPAAQEEIQKVSEESPIQQQPQQYTSNINIQAPVTNQLPKSKNNFFKNIVSAICCVMIFVLLLSSLALVTARSIVSPDSVEDILEEVDIKDIVENTPIEEIVHGLDARQLEKIYHETELEDYIEDVAMDYSKYLLGGRKPDGLDSERIMEIFVDEYYTIAEIHGKPLDSYELYRISEFFSDEDNIGFLSPDVVTTPELETVRTFISYPVIIILFVLALAFGFLLFFVRKYKADSFVWVAVPVILTSIILMISFSASSLFLTLFEGSDRSVTNAVKSIAEEISSPAVATGFLFLILGIISIIAYVIIKNKRSKTQADA